LGRQEQVSFETKEELTRACHPSENLACQTSYKPENIHSVNIKIKHALRALNLRRSKPKRKRLRKRKSKQICTLARNIFPF
jgi:hypothetical protein